MSCEHDFEFLRRLRVVEQLPDGRTQQTRLNVFYCRKCLQHQEVILNVYVAGESTAEREFLAGLDAKHAAIDAEHRDLMPQLADACVRLIGQHIATGDTPELTDPGWFSRENT